MLKLLLALVLVAAVSASLQAKLDPRCTGIAIGHETPYSKTVTGVIRDRQASAEFDVNNPEVLCPDDLVEGAAAAACDHDYAPSVTFRNSNPRIVDIIRKGDSKGEAEVTVTVYCTEDGDQNSSNI